jgi:hypothetical protein
VEGSNGTTLDRMTVWRVAVAAGPVIVTGGEYEREPVGCPG